MTRRRPLFVCCALALAVALVACGDGDGGGDRQSPAASPGDAALSVEAWAGQVCALSVKAADTLDVPGPEDPETLALDQRKQRAADVLAPLAQALGVTAQDLADLQPPAAAAELHDVLRTTMADISLAWQDLVDAAERAESSEELNAANDVLIQAQNEADAAVIAAYHVLDREVTAALSEPEDCGILNEIRS